jgi:hypothetical protein
LVYHSLAEAYQSTGNYLESERWFRTAVDQVQESRQQQHKKHHKRMATVSSRVQQQQQQPTRSDQVAAHLTYARFLAKNVSGSHHSFIIPLPHLHVYVRHFSVPPFPSGRPPSSTSPLFFIFVFP